MLEINLKIDHIKLKKSLKRLENKLSFRLSENGLPVFVHRGDLLYYKYGDGYG